MPRTIKLHLDENVNGAVAEGLIRRGIDVTTTPAAGLLGADDPAQLEHARREGRVLFTQDQDFLRLHSSAPDHAGIAYAPKDQRSIGQLIRSLELLWELLEAEEMVGRVEFL